MFYNCYISEAVTGIASIAQHPWKSTSHYGGAFCSLLGGVTNLVKWVWLTQTMLRVLQFGIAVSMLILTLDWVIADGSQRAWLAVLGVLLTLIQLVQRRLCE